jgi:hypothetical protein
MAGPLNVIGVTPGALCFGDNWRIPPMARYIQRIALLGKERWIGWEIDGVGTEIPGLLLADELPHDDPRLAKVKEFTPLAFETFLEMNATGVATKSSGALLDEDVEFRLDALQVGIERLRGRGQTDVPRSLFTTMLGDEAQLNHPRVRQRLDAWQRDGAVEFVGKDDCWLRVLRPL